MKKLLVLLLVLVVAALGGYTFYWNKKADEVKTLITEAVGKLNTAAKPFTGNDVITYESAQTSGWPFNVNVTLKKPVITIPVHVIAKAMNEAEKNKSKDDVLKKEPKLNVADNVTWTETYSGDATVFSTDLFATKVSISHEGEQKAVSTFNGVQADPITFRAAIPYKCTLNLTRAEGSSELFDVKSIFKSGDDFMKRFRTFSCGAKGISTTNAKTNEALSSAESANMEFALDTSNKAQTTGRIAMSVINQKATKSQDKIVENYLAMIYRLFMNKAPDMSFFGIPMSELGSNTIEIDMSYAGPADPALFIAKDMNLNISIDKFRIQNDLMKIESEMHVKSNPAQNAEQRDSSFVIRSTGNYAARYDELKMKEIQKIVEGLLKEDGDPEFKELRENVLKKLKIEEVRQAIDELWPRFHPYGNITFAVDVAAKTPNPPLSPTGDLVVNNLDFVTSLDGIKISGKAEQKGVMPTGEVKITCLSCEGLLNRTYAYVRVWEKWITRLDETFKSEISEELFTGVKQFLKEISVPAKDATGKEVANDWFYHIKMTGEAEPTLNDKPVMKVMESFGQNVAPYLPNGGGKAGAESEEGAPESKYEPEDKASEAAPETPEVAPEGGEEEKPTN